MTFINNGEPGFPFQILFILLYIQHLTTFASIPSDGSSLIQLKMEFKNNSVSR